jgi:hypothetical protein
MLNTAQRNWNCMKTAPVLPFLFFALATSVGHGGTIEGTVANTSTGTPVPCQAEVVLQMQINGQFMPFKEVKSDTEGRYLFKNVPEGADNLYLIGANRQGIFYPGPRVRLVSPKPNAYAELSVCDAVTNPSPLVLKKMEVTIRPELGMLKVTERLLIDNPSRTCYVGEAATADGAPITLALSIPPDFQRLTFDKEFFGRHFAVFDNRVVTSIPWTPGEREVGYTYVIRNEKGATAWQRPMDLPCSDVTVRIEGESPDEVHCGLLTRLQDGLRSVIYTSAGQTIPAEQILRVELGRLPLPWMTYSKWAAVAILLVIIVATSWLHFARRRAEARREAERQIPRATRRRRAA